MGEVLILGNGISRISYHNLIIDWPGEVWGCNRVYKKYGAKLTRLAGHKDVLVDAAKYRKEHNLLFEIWGGHLGNLPGADKSFTCEKKFCRDSGITLVAQALHEGRQIAVCGFDLGGPDIHSPGLENVDKHNWITRWRKLLGQYGQYGRERIRFIGFDHLPYILSGRPTSEYSKFYKYGKPHIYDPDYLRVWKEWAGRPAYYKKEEAEMKVRFKDGRIVDMKGPVALKMAAKGKVKILKSDKAKAKAEAEEKYKELLKIAAELGIKKPDKMKEKELIEAIEAAKDEDK